MCVKKMKGIPKRLLAVMLAVLVGFGSVSVLGLGDVKASAATAGSYYVKVYWNVSDDSDKGDNTWSLTYKDQQGNENTYNYSSNAASSNGDKDSGVLTLSGVPYKVFYQLHNSGGWKLGGACWYIKKITISNNANMTGAVTLWEGNIGCKCENVLAQTINCTYNIETKTAGSWSNGAGSDKKQETSTLHDPFLPKATSITAITGDGSVNVPTDGTSTNSTSAYTAGTVKDQYGVNWYQDATISLTTGHTGVSYDSSTKKISVYSNGNAKDNYSVTLTETCGSATNTKNVTVNVFDYNVTFKDHDGTVLKTQTGVDYGGSATAPADPSRAYDSTNHYAFAGWTGDGYTNITSGAQAKTVTASYTATVHDSFLQWQSNATEHWQQCSVCGYTTARQSHNLEWITTEETHLQKCSDCGYIKVAQTSHTYGDWSVTTEATCDGEGSKTRSCTACGHTQTQAVSALGHDYQFTRTVAPTCLAQGYDIYTCSRCGATENRNLTAKLSHSYIGEIRNNNDGTHSFKCVNGCNEYGATVNCNYGDWSADTATCLEGGSKSHTCADCGYEETVSTDALGHDYQFTRTVAPTCLEQGYDIYTCSRCGATENRNYQNALGHNFTGAARDNGNGTHSFLCANGCGTYGAPEDCAYGEYTDDGNGNFIKECTVCHHTVSKAVYKNDFYVIDSGLPIELDVLENDAAGATLSGVSIANAAVDGTKVKFTPPSIMTDKVTFTYTASYDSKPYTANVTVIPATNVYFEESFVTLGPAISGGDSLWSVDGTSPAAEAFADVESLNGYGYNSAYENQSTYSMGTVYKTTVKRGDPSRKATFTFTGTGFDVYSLTDSTCGVIMVNIKKLNNGEWVQVSNKVLSTYFGNEYGPLYLKDGKVTLDSDGAAIYPATANSSNTFFIQGSDKGTTEYYEGAKQINGWVATGAEGNGIYQTPVISETLGYGTYTVTIEPRYSAIFDTAGKGQFSFYLDSIRIYNPINPESVTAGTDVYEKYLADKEQGAQYESIREKIIAADTFGETGQYTAGVAFLEKMNSSTGNSAIKNYSDIGPKNEVYLEPNQAIAFNITTGGAVQPAKVAVGIRVIKGTNGKATVASSRSNQYSLSGATELYRDITAQLDFVLSDGKYTTAQPVVIANTSGENIVIALTKIKYSFGAQEQNAPAGARQLMFTFDEPALLNSRGIMNTIFNPVITADSTGVTAKWDKTNIALGETATLTITADENYTKAFIDGGEAAGYSEENGVRTWTYAFTGSELGENAFDIKLQDINGYMTASIEAGNVKVTAPEVDINDAKISWSKDTVKSGEKVTLTVTAPSNIVKVSVGKTDITQSVTLDSGEKQFTYELETGTAGEYKYTVILTETYGYTSKNGETPVLTVEPVTPEAPEEQPGEGGGDEQPEEENLTFFQKIIRFIVNLFNKVMELFKGIF